MDDDYTLQQELEALAGNAFNAYFDNNDDTGKGNGNDNAKPKPISETMARWQHLFKLSAGDAVDRIQSHRNNLTRTRISDAHWDMIQSEKESQGYDREAYEYEVELQKKAAGFPDLLPAAEDSGVTYLMEMNGPLGTPDKVQHAARMPEAPVVVSGTSLEERRPVWLCCIDAPAKTALLRWAAGEGGGFEPTILADPRSLR